jgi:hypothetical protein
VQSSADPVSVLLEVRDVWKGVDTTQVWVWTAKHGESCGYEGFEVGQEYVVFAYGEPERLETGLCERTKPLASAAADLAALGTAYTPTEQVELRGGGRFGGGSRFAGISLSIWAGVVALLLLAGLAVWKGLQKK